MLGAQANKASSETRPCTSSVVAGDRICVTLRRKPPFSATTMKIRWGRRGSQHKVPHDERSRGPLQFGTEMNAHQGLSNFPPPLRELAEHTGHKVGGSEARAILRADAPAEPGNRSGEPQRHGETGVTDLDHPTPVLASRHETPAQIIWDRHFEQLAQGQQLRFERVPLQPASHDLGKAEPVDALWHLRQLGEIVEMTQIEGSPPIVSLLDLVMHDQVQRSESRRRQPGLGGIVRGGREIRGVHDG